MKLLVTGAAGFIGSTFCRLFAREHDIIGIDAMTYAADATRLPEEMHFVRGRIEYRVAVEDLLRECDAIVNFAAETHVDRSITGQNPFVISNVVGVASLLDAARAHKVPRFVQISTDEVYGSIDHGSADESFPLRPSSPYSATKAAADLLIQAHAHTYGIDTVICRGSNNYGPGQYPEKLIPLAIKLARAGEQVPIYGDGRQVRNWLYVEDFCRAIELAMREGRAGAIYNVGGPDERTNLQVIDLILTMLGRSPEQIKHVEDRLGHDRRYSLDSSQIGHELGWSPEVGFIEGLERTVHAS